MAEVEYATTAKLPVETIWEFVREMDNWAPFLTGYQSHEKQSDDDSIWILKGDVGSLTRTVKFQVCVTEWAGPERVTFTLKGLNEDLEGEGALEMERFEAEADSAPASPVTSVPSFLSRAITAIFRFFFRKKFGETERGEHADAGRGEGMAKLTFRLRLDPGGPMAPMVNALIKPPMLVAAEDLANKIIGHLEAKSAAAG